MLISIIDNNFEHCRAEVQKMQGWWLYTSTWNDLVKRLQDACDILNERWQAWQVASAARIEAKAEVDAVGDAQVTVPKKFDTTDLAHKLKAFVRVLQQFEESGYGRYLGTQLQTMMALYQESIAKVDDRSDAESAAPEAGSSDSLKRAIIDLNARAEMRSEQVEQLHSELMQSQQANAEMQVRIGGYEKVSEQATFALQKLALLRPAPQVLVLLQEAMKQCQEQLTSEQGDAQTRCSQALMLLTFAIKSADRMMPNMATMCDLPEVKAEELIVGQSPKPPVLAGRSSQVS